ncbi:MAG: SLC45 family MFS transporter [Anaerolineales bacterium]
MKLDYKKTFTLGFGFLGISLLWSLYNSFVPIFLQSGNPEFTRQLLEAGKALPTVAGFGLSAGVAGFIMTLDNIAAVFIQPWIGVRSDKTRTRWGRRMPYILAGAPIAAVAFAVIPFVVKAIPQSLNGQLSEMKGLFALFIVAIGVMLLAMSIFRTPVIALMPDIIPSPLRSKANGVINLMGGVGSLLAFFGGSMLYNIDPALPFVVGAVVMLGACLIVVWRIKEPKDFPDDPEEKQLGVIANLKEVLADPDRSAIRILLAIFFWFLAFNALETFFTSYGVFYLGISESRAALLLGFFSVAFIIFSIPAGFIATKFGRKRTILTGIVSLAVLLFLGYWIPNVTFITVMLVLAGFAWALININSLPMVVDIAPQSRLGSYTGLYYFFSASAAIVGPIVAGALVDWVGAYNVIMLSSPVFALIAGLFMLGVTRGEAITE